MDSLLPIKEKVVRQADQFARHYHELLDAILLIETSFQQEHTKLSQEREYLKKGREENETLLEEVRERERLIEEKVLLLKEREGKVEIEEAVHKARLIK